MMGSLVKRSSPQWKVLSLGKVVGKLPLNLLLTFSGGAAAAAAAAAATKSKTKKIPKFMLVEAELVVSSFEVCGQLRARASERASERSGLARWRGTETERVVYTAYVRTL